MNAPQHSGKLTLRLAFGCEAHGQECTVVAFESIDGTVATVVHLNPVAARKFHERLGQRVLALEVPRVVVPGD